MINYLETLRMCPPLIIAVFRMASQTYRFPDKSLTLEKGDKLVIPIYSLYYDSKYYPDPQINNLEGFHLRKKLNGLMILIFRLAMDLEFV